MLFKRKRVVPTGYATTRFLLAYFIVGLLILSLAFVYYTKQILQLDRALEEQVGPLADLAATLPAVKERELQDRLTRIVKKFLTASRLSFVITDAVNGEVVIAKGVDETIDRKVNTEPSIALSTVEEAEINDALGRMERKNEPKRIQYSLENRELYAYFYHGDADATAIHQVPFVVADLNREPQMWRIWGGDLVTAKGSAAANLPRFASRLFLLRGDTVLRYHDYADCPSIRVCDLLSCRIFELSAYKV